MSEPAVHEGVAFAELVESYRPELHLHCYRMLGSLQDAEDLVQETLLAAWRGIDRFRGEASVRSWLYRIATNKCLNALRDAGRRPVTTSEIAWAEPYPDHLVGTLADAAPGPEAQYETKETLALAFVTALQHLPVQQRAAVVLRDVLGFPAAEVAHMLGSSPAAVNSALQRARAALPQRAGSAASRRLPPAGERELVDRFATAFAESDVAGLIALLTSDARLAMPPEPLVCVGPGEIGALLTRLWQQRPAVRLVPVRANGQPAFGYYQQIAHSSMARANGLLVVTVADARISAITRFGDTALFPYFGLPRSLR
ncbi:RNA polymerase subunit sigma-70 [Nocardia sp. NPDC020380]|uniref:RNA polymerase subunit sigma-70 n=1 Tax=Nocardia sp. NPDC020380 TaxID=3364309 RepID=UPI0037B77508